MRDLPRLIRETEADVEEIRLIEGYALAVENLPDVCPLVLPNAGGRPSEVATRLRRIATHRNPDIDAIVACWIAERFLFPLASTEIVFVPREFAVPVPCPYDCVLDVGRQFDASRLLFDHKPPGIEDPHSTCATKQLWDHLRIMGVRVRHLAALVYLTWDGDSSRRRPSSSAYQESRTNGLHAEWKKQNQLQKTDVSLYQVTRDWLDHRYSDEEASRIRER